MDLIADPQAPGGELPRVDKQVSAAGLGDAPHLDDRRRPNPHAPGVAHLPSTLSVEGRVVEDDFHHDGAASAGLRIHLLHELTVGHEPQHLARALQVVVAHELCLPQLLRHASEGQAGREVDLLPGILPPLPLRLHLLLKALSVDPDTGRFCHLLGDLEREPKCVVQHEGVRPAEFGLATLVLGRLQHLIQLLLAAVQGLDEALLLAPQLLEDPVGILLYQGVAGLAERHHHLGQRGGEDLLDANDPSLHDDTADKTAHDIAASNV
mmetsp:Transcript_21035/g.58375  ORF Transcript_21035/g.58375 Transcript_21035/m.58375 type:complete len:266 (-) Transcript_21035:938-1735(-)